VNIAFWGKSSSAKANEDPRRYEVPSLGDEGTREGGHQVFSAVPQACGSEWFIRISKVGNASLLVVEVLINHSNFGFRLVRKNQEDEKNSLEFFEAY